MVDGEGMANGDGPTAGEGANGSAVSCSDTVTCGTIGNASGRDSPSDTPGGSRVTISVNSPRKAGTSPDHAEVANGKRRSRAVSRRPMTTTSLSGEEPSVRPNSPRAAYEEISAKDRKRKGDKAYHPHTILPHPFERGVLTVLGILEAIA